MTKKVSNGVSHRGYSTDKTVVPKSLPSGPAPGAKKSSAPSAVKKKSA
ncbi:MAG TPA: hypothetical protein VNA20_08325 [Frankiaceae bacterium]|nr:hypothetical protein [Frankiaceae bacterium]